jgi:hypothetical protein
MISETICAGNLTGQWPIGYIPTDPEKLRNARSSNVRLSIFYQNGTGQNEIFFDNAHELIRFLHEHPAIAKLVQYDPTKKQTSGKN